MADRSMDFTGNNDWPNIGKAIDPEDHPANNMPTATKHFDGVELGTEPYQDSGNQSMDYAHKPANSMIQDRLNSRN